MRLRWCRCLRLPVLLHANNHYSEQSIQAMIKKINHEDNIIKIDQQHKPYKYSINLDVVSKLKES